MRDRGHAGTSESAREANVKPLNRDAAAQCVFCAIARGAEKAEVVFRDDTVIAFLDHRPLQRGHTLVAPLAHAAVLDDLPEAQIGPLFSRVRLVKRALESALHADGAFIAMNDRVSQSVAHVHVHVVPRWKNDGLFSRALVWKRQPYRSEEEMRALADAIRAAPSR
jgi:histidine triad (HIT) family protein